MTPSVNPSTSIPYTALFDPDQLLQEEEQRKKQLQDSQKKIMRTNAIGEALRLITDAIGGSAGATIAQRPVNQSILNASQRYNALEDNYQATRQKYKLSEIASRQNLAQEDRQNKEWDRRFKTQEEATATRQGAENTEWDRRFEKQENSRQDEATRTTQRQKDVDTHQTDENIRQAKTIADMKEPVSPDENNPYYEKWRATYGKKNPFMTIEDTENGATIPLTDGQASQILKWMRNDPAIPPNVRTQIDPNDIANNLVFKSTVTEHWNRYKDLVRKMVLGQKISMEDEKSIVENGKKAKRVTDYDAALKKINESDLRPKQRVKQINQLNEEYKDLFQKKEETSFIPDVDGVTDVTSIFNQ